MYCYMKSFEIHVICGLTDEVSGLCPAITAFLSGKSFSMYKVVCVSDVSRSWLSETRTTLYMLKDLLETNALKAG